jgi:hypothetical protein
MIPGSANPLLLATAAAGGYSISRSVRFNSSDSAYLSRTPASAGNRKTWTWAGWVKRSALGGDQVLFGACPSPGGADNDHYGLLISGDALWSSYYTGTQVFQCTTSAVLRDPSAWYHIAVAFDTTQATASNRIKIYVNSAIQTLSTASYPSQNYDGQINSAIFHSIGKHPRVSGSYLSGYVADIHFIDGQALDPTSFGEFSATTGVWMPKAYTGTYGTNGFKLNFSDNSTAAALGTDSSGAGNTWTVNNLSVTAGAGNDSLVDVPTNGSEVDTGAGGQVRGNYCTLNPLGTAGATPSDGNLSISSSSTVGNRISTFFLTSGKWYWEGSGTGYVGAIVGRGGEGFTGSISGTGSKAIGWWQDGPVYWDGGDNGGSTTFTSTDVIGIALDMDAGNIKFYKNNSLIYTITFGSGTVPNLSSGVFPGYNVGASTRSASFNFGQRPFAYPVAGYKSLNTASLPAPVITKPSTVMDVALWTGSSTASARTISGLQFSPDLVWAKSRSLSYSHNLYDTVRGTGKGLYSDSTGAESTNNIYGYISAFNSDGFTATPGSTDNGFFNETNATYAAWCWDAGSSTVTDNTGSIQSSRRTNASAGISIVTWTQTGSSGDTPTVGHGLGVAPSLILTKNRGGAVDWRSYHASLGVNKVIWLNSTLGAGDIGSPPGWSISSTTFGMKNGQVVDSGNSMVAYCFAPVAGYANAFSYSGNGSTDGPMVYLGFRPALIILKRTDSANDWGIFDNKRLGYNPQTAFLFPNASYSESASDYMDLLSNGFKIRRTNAEYNASGGTYIGFAWAESPFQYARAR